MTDDEREALAKEIGTMAIHNVDNMWIKGWNAALFEAARVARNIPVGELNVPPRGLRERIEAAQPKRSFPFTHAGQGFHRCVEHGVIECQAAHDVTRG